MNRNPQAVAAAGPEAGEAQPLADTAQSGEPGPLDAGTQTDRSARDRRDRQAPMGRATCDVSGRVLASSGQAGPVEPQFASAARGVRSGGVLTALPALLKEGLLAASDALPLLPKGYYGLNTILLFLAFMTLARVRNPESLRYRPPGEWGAILGLDRCPEVKTLRRNPGWHFFCSAVVYRFDMGRYFSRPIPAWHYILLDSVSSSGGPSCGGWRGPRPPPRRFRQPRRPGACPGG